MSIPGVDYDARGHVHRLVSDMVLELAGVLNDYHLGRSPEGYRTGLQYRVVFLDSAGGIVVVYDDIGNPEEALKALVLAKRRGWPEPFLQELLAINWTSGMAMATDWRRVEV